MFQVLLPEVLCTLTTDTWLRYSGTGQIQYIPRGVDSKLPEKKCVKAWLRYTVSTDYHRIIPMDDAHKIPNTSLIHSLPRNRANIR